MQSVLQLSTYGLMSIFMCSVSTVQADTPEERVLADCTFIYLLKIPSNLAHLSTCRESPSRPAPFSSSSFRWKRRRRICSSVAWRQNMEVNLWLYGYCRVTPRSPLGYSRVTAWAIQRSQINLYQSVISTKIYLCSKIILRLYIFIYSTLQKRQTAV